MYVNQHVEPFAAIKVFLQMKPKFSDNEREIPVIAMYLFNVYRPDGYFHNIWKR